MKKFYMSFLLIVFSLIALALVLNVYIPFRSTNSEINKQEWAKLLANHPFNNRPQQPIEDWKKIPKADRPDLAMEQDVLMTMDPALGSVPTERKMIANKAVDDLLKMKGPIPGVTWQERGPNNVGGRSRALMFDPNDPTYKKVWSAGVSGGLWYTNDITADPPDWNHVDGFWNNIVVCAIAYNPANTQEFYVGTGEGWFNADAQRGGGIWKTSDGGVTWNHLANTDPGVYNSSSHFHYVSKIVIKANGYIFAATRGYYVNTGGIMRSTDGGVTWTRVLSQYVSGTYRDWGADIEIAANGDLYASMGIYSAGQVYKSLNANNGASGTWTNLSTNIGMANAKRIELACAPSNSNVIYAVAQGGSGDNDVEWFKKSTDGGTTWSALSIPLMVDGSGNHFTRGQAFYDLILAVHPTDPNLVIVGGIDLHRSANGGTTWTGISHWYGGFGKPEVHADHHAIVFRPGAGDEVIFGHDGGFTYSTNAGNSSATPTFTDKNTGYNITQFYACAAKNETASNYFLTGAQDNGSQKFTMPQIGSTTEVSGGDGAFCHIDQINPDIQTTAYINNNIYRSLDGGNSFPSLISESSGHFINPSDYDSQRKILYLAANSDQLKRISGMDGAITNTNLAIPVGPAKVSAIKVSPYNDVLFLGIENGRVYMFSNASTGTPTLSRIDNGTLPITTAGWVSSIDVGSNDNNIMVTYSNYGVTSIWETTDGGVNWYSKEGNLPDMPVRWGLYNPENRNQVLLATEVGVWSTDNFGTGTNSAPDWGISSTNLAYTRCTMLKYRPADKMVVVSSHGRGLFTSDIFVTTSVADFVADQIFTCSGSLTVHFLDGSLKAGGSWAWDVNNDGTTDYTSQNPTHTYSSPGLYSVKLTINNGITSVTKENLILVMNSEPTVNTGCNLSSNSNNGNGYGIGIFRFALGNIDYNTSNNDGYYQNYSCSKWTTLELNKSYNITIRTGTANNEGAMVYIDYNDNGTFETGEAVVSFPANKDGTRTLSFTTPSSGVVLDKGLRLRVLSKFSSIPSNACDISSYGQAEDYTVFVVSDATWAGLTSSEWTTAGNWNINSIPVSGAKIKIPAGASNYPVLTSTVTCKDLTIMPGASVTINPGNALTVNGLLTNNAGNAGLIIKSDATGTGSLIENNGVNATVERYITQNKWHYISAPVDNPAASVFMGMYMMQWNEPAEAWSNISDPNYTMSTDMQGFAIWSQSGQTGNATVTFSGHLNSGSKSIVTTNTAGGLDLHNGYNFVGNPYPSALDWNVNDGNGWSRTAGNIDLAVYIWNQTAGNYGVYVKDGGFGTNGVDNIIPPHQGFFVRCSAATGSLGVNNGARIHNIKEILKSGEDASDHLILMVEGNNYYDEIILKTDVLASVLFDQFDALKMYSSVGAPQFYSMSKDGEELSINAFTESEDYRVIPLGLKAGAPCEYSITVKELSGFNTSGKLVLEDLKKGIFTPLFANSSYSFTSDPLDEPGRFLLHLNSELDVSENLTSNNQIKVYSFDQQVYISSESIMNGLASIYDLTGKEVFKAKLNGETMKKISLEGHSGYLIVKVLTETGNLNQKIFIK
jgi:PKD repeat protein